MKIILGSHKGELDYGDLIITDGGGIYTVLYNGFNDEFDSAIYSFTKEEIVILLCEKDSLIEEVSNFFSDEYGETIVNIISHKELILINKNKLANWRKVNKNE